MKSNLKKTSYLIQLGNVSEKTKGWMGAEADWLGAKCMTDFCWGVEVRRHQGHG